MLYSILCYESEALAAGRAKQEDTLGSDRPK
jgi:hypothetical protein